MIVVEVITVNQCWSYSKMLLLLTVIGIAKAKAFFFFLFEKVQRLKEKLHINIKAKVSHK